MISIPPTRAALDELVPYFRQFHVRKVHVAVMREPWLSYVLDGSKTIESRFSKDRRAPWQAVEPWDVILWKAAGGPVVARSTVSKVEYHHPWPDSPDALRGHCDRIRIPVERLDEHLAAGRLYASLFTIMRPVPFDEPFGLIKRDQRAWIVLPDGAA